MARKPKPESPKSVGLEDFFQGTKSVPELPIGTHTIWYRREPYGGPHGIDLRYYSDDVWGEHVKTALPGKRCLYCLNLRDKDKLKCPFCGAPYSEEEL